MVGGKHHSVLFSGLALGSITVVLKGIFASTVFEVRVTFFWYFEHELFVR